MILLKKKLVNITKNVGLVGGYLPQPLLERFNLFSVYKKTSKSTIIRKLVEEELLNSPSIDNMIKSIADSFLLLWRNTVPFSMYKTTVQQELKKRKLSAIQVEQIITVMENTQNGVS